VAWKNSAKALRILIGQFSLFRTFMLIHSFNSRFPSWSLLSVAGLALLGCGPTSDRLPVSGVVTLDGIPLDDGSIRFSSTGEKLVATGTLIRAGEFSIPAEKGLPPGTYRLEITSPDNNAAPVVYRDASGAPGIPTQPERIPPEFNMNSQKTVDVTVEGDNHFEFAIQSQAKK
jgi:hypothetical protein